MPFKPNHKTIAYGPFRFILGAAHQTRAVCSINDL